MFHYKFRLMKSKKLFSHKNVCKVAIVLIILAHLANSFSVRHKVKILDEIEAPSKANIYKLAYTDSIIGSVKKGEKVKIIGFYNKRYAFWAESESGIRGLIPIEELGYKFKAKNPSTKKSEIVSNVKCEGYPYKYDVVFDDGTKAKIKHDNMEPQVSGKIRRHIISQSAGKYHILESKFNRKLLGKSLEKIEKKASPALYVYYKKDKMIAEFTSLRVMGDKGRHMPVLIFDKEGNSELLKWKETDSRLIAKIFPFRKLIMGRNALCRMIDSSIYNGPEFSFNGIIGKIVFVFLAIIMVFMVLVWYWLTPMLPAFVVGYLIHYPHVLKKFSNKQLFKFIAVVSIICVYVWIVVLGCRGMVAIFMLFNIVTALLSFKFITFPLLDKIPHDRCPECKEMYKIEELKTEFWKEYIEYDHEKVKVRDVAKDEKKWMTYIVTTYKYSNGRPSYTTVSDKKEHTETTTTTLYKDYSIAYRVKVYRITYRCNVCGMLEYDFKNSYEQISRKETGQHTETDTKKTTRPIV